MVCLVCKDWKFGDICVNFFIVKQFGGLNFFQVDNIRIFFFYILVYDWCSIIFFLVGQVLGLKGV